MPRQLKVYGIVDFVKPRDYDKLDPNHPWCRQARYVAAVYSKREFAELLHSTIGRIAPYCSQTWNPIEVQPALAKPHTLIFIKLV